MERCRGADSRARRNAADPNRLTIKRHAAPICHCEEAQPTWQSREGSYDFAGNALLSDHILRDSHVALLLGMTNLGALRR